MSCSYYNFFETLKANALEMAQKQKKTFFNRSVLKLNIATMHQGCRKIKLLKSLNHNVKCTHIVQCTHVSETQE